MANRFTVTEKWQDPWFRRLGVNEKLLFMYFCDTCEIARKRIAAAAAQGNLFHEVQR